LENEFQSIYTTAKMKKYQLPKEMNELWVVFTKEKLKTPRIYQGNHGRNFPLELSGSRNWWTTLNSKLQT